MEASKRTETIHLPGGQTVTIWSDTPTEDFKKCHDMMRGAITKLGMPVEESTTSARVICYHLHLTQQVSQVKMSRLLRASSRDYTRWLNRLDDNKALTAKIRALCRDVAGANSQPMPMVTIKVWIGEESVNVDIPPVASIYDLIHEVTVKHAAVLSYRVIEGWYSKPLQREIYGFNNGHLLSLEESLTFDIPPDADDVVYEKWVGNFNVQLKYGDLWPKSTGKPSVDKHSRHLLHTNKYELVAKLRSMVDD